jgi:hypothetical protein
MSPPAAVKVVAAPLHIVVTLEDNPEGAVGAACTVAATATRADTQPVAVFAACA